MNCEEYEREVARRFANLRRAARRRALDRVKEIVCGLATAAMVVALMYAIAKYTTSRDRLVAEAETAESRVTE